MGLTNLFKTAWGGIIANQMRAALTSLGIIIGVASVIATLALGNGARAAVEARFRFLGSDQVQITTNFKLEQGESVPVGQIVSYDDGLVLASTLELVDRVEMTVYSTGRVRNGRVALSNVTIRGTVATYLDSIAANGELQPADWEEEGKPGSEAFLAYGRFYTPAEVLSWEEVCVLGYQTAEDLFEGVDPLGETILVNRKTCEVIGVLSEMVQADSSKHDHSGLNDGIYLPVSTTVEGLFDEQPAVTIVAHVTDESRMDDAVAGISSLLRERHGIEETAEGYFEDDFYLTTKEALLGAQQEAARTFSVLLTALAAVSLVVGGIGIMNVMLVSVTERTREIGVRRAVGAKRVDVVFQFLIEAILLSSISGVLGIALGILLIPALASFHDGIALLDPLSIPLSFGVAMFTGVIFGLYPAIQASQLDPIEALRHV
ncbi:MAG: FtsX-like permease family protein [Anaerolineales bacterium]|nr:FtsX-like permease family protein [Anaerolineales bacterium]